MTIKTQRAPQPKETQHPKPDTPDRTPTITVHTANALPADHRTMTVIVMNADTLMSIRDGWERIFKNKLNSFPFFNLDHITV